MRWQRKENRATRLDSAQVYPKGLERINRVLPIEFAARSHHHRAFYPYMLGSFHVVALMVMAV